MKVIIIRHFKVDHPWKTPCSSTEFDEECRQYDMAPIEAPAESALFMAERIYISTLARSLQTAKILFGNRSFCRTRLINEVPLRSAFDTEHELPLWFWNISGRLQWFCNSIRQPEPRFMTTIRAKRFIQKLMMRDEDCVIVTHGFFMHTLLSQMKHYGFNTAKTGIHYDNGEAVVLVK